MKVLGLLFLTLVMLVLPSLGQKPADLAPTASIEETQKWLTTALNSFAKFTNETGYQTESFYISDVKFDQCEISYRYTKDLTYKSLQATTSMGSPTNSSIPRDLVTLIKFRFSDID